jgi:hypothetical protein
MTDQRQPQPDTIDEADPDVRELLGLRPSEAPSVATESEVDTLGQMTATGIDEGDLAARPPDSDQPDDPIAGNIEMLTETELRDGETDDPTEAAEEGLTWVPPMDPPLRPGDDGPEVAAGFGMTAEDEPFDADHHSEALSPVDEVETRVVEALRADAATAELADNLELDVENGVVRVAGRVPDLEDEDAIVGVIDGAAGVTSVDSRIIVTEAEGGAVETP